MTKPLDGVLVVSIEQAVAAPVCTARLADAGARVIKVERPEGDFARRYDTAVKGEATYFVWANRGKESLCLDLKQGEDRALLDRILTRADVFVQNLAVGAAERLGLGAGALAERFPRLVTCALSGYGEDGPYATMRAYDMLVQAESGLTSISGEGRIGVSIADIVTGINASAAILEALLLRAKTGRGSAVSLSLFSGMADLMAVPLLQTAYTGRPPVWSGMAHPSIVPYGAFPTADGRAVVISIQNEREWTRLCNQVLGRPELIDDPRTASNTARTANRAFVEDAVAGATRCHEAEALRRLLVAAGIACGLVNSVPDVLTHPALCWADVTLPDGQAARIPAPPITAPWTRPDPAAIPALGADSARLRQEFAPHADTADV